MHIIYAASTCSDQTYRELFSDVAVKPAFQSQKYHRLLIEGLAAHGNVDVAAVLPVNKSLMKTNVLRIPTETEGGARYHYAVAYRNSLLRLLSTAWGTFWRTFRLAGRDSAVIVDCLHCTNAVSAQLAARLRGRRCVGIVTDLPEMLGQGSGFTRLSQFAIRHCSDYVFLTEAMNQRLNPVGKPYVILEGHADISMEQKIPSLNQKGSERIILYAGGVCVQYGLKNLVEGFRKTNLSNTKLVIYGPGDYVEELKTVAQEDSRVVYGGMLLSGEIVEKEMEATLLVNPRPVHEEFVKYSFPSKTMEYMASGTPVLTTVLPGMPKEYYPYVSLIQEPTPEGIRQALEEVLSLSDDALFEKGCAAREFVLKQRNNVVQAGKILAMLSKQRK